MTRLPVTSVTDDSLRQSIFVSGGIHFAILLFLIFGLPHFMKPLPEPYIPVPIEIVDIADITNTRVKEEPEPPKPPEATPPKPEEQKTVQQYQPPTPPAPPQPQPKPAEPQKTEQVEALMPKPAEKPKPPAPAAKPQADLLASVLKNVEKMKPAEKAPDTKSQVKVQTQAQPQPKSLAPSLSNRVTISEKDALVRQLEGCWNFDPGAPNAKDLTVDITIVVNPDRTVQNAEVVDKGRMARDPYFRAAAEAAIRAVYNPKCSPLELPEGKYEDWKNTSFTFNPRDML